jgi:hypothetical protein
LSVTDIFDGTVKEEPDGEGRKGQGDDDFEHGASVLRFPKAKIFQPCAEPQHTTKNARKKD